MSDAAKLIFFSHSRIMFHVFFLFFSAAIRHIAQSGIYFRRIIPAWLLPASHNQSSCLPQSILRPPTINPTAPHNQSSCLSPSLLLPPTITPLASHHQSSCLTPSILQSPTINPTASQHHSSCLPKSILQSPGISSLLYYMAFLHYVPLSVLPSPPSR